MTDDLTQTAFRIADEAMDEAVTYLVQRGRAGRHCLAVRVDG